MRKSFKLIIFLCLIIFAGVSISLCEFMGLWKNTNTCKGDVALEGADGKISLLLQFHFFQNNGLVEINGFYSLNNGEKKKVNRQVLFKLNRNKDKHIMISTKIYERDDIAIMNIRKHQIMPDFFMYKNSTLVLDRISSGNGETVFLWSGLPFLYCFRQ